MKTYTTPAGILKALRSYGFEGALPELPAPGAVREFALRGETVFLMGCVSPSLTNGKRQWSVFQG